MQRHRLSPRIFFFFVKTRPDGAREESISKQRGPHTSKAMFHNALARMRIPLRPRQIELVLCARERHVIEALLLFNGAIVFGFAESGSNEHSLELKSFGSVHRHDLHAVAFALLLAKGAVLASALVVLPPCTQEFCEVVRHKRRTAFLHKQPVEDLSARRPPAIVFIVIRRWMRQCSIVHHAFKERDPRTLH